MDDKRGETLLEYNLINKHFHVVCVYALVIVEKNV